MPSNSTLTNIGMQIEQEHERCAKQIGFTRAVVSCSGAVHFALPVINTVLGESASPGSVHLCENANVAH